MDYIGIGLGEWLVILINLLLVGGWFLLALIALFQLRHRDLPDTSRAIWAALILLIPVGGAVAFWIVQPGKRFQAEIPKNGES